MGYHTDSQDSFKPNPALTPEHREYHCPFCQTPLLNRSIWFDHRYSMTCKCINRECGYLYSLYLKDNQIVSEHFMINHWSVDMERANGTINLYHGNKFKASFSGNYEHKDCASLIQRAEKLQTFQ